MTRALAQLGFLSALALMSCAEPRIVPVIGPDGTRMMHVSCGGDEARCFEMAGEACPSGYEIMPTAGKNYLVRCRTGASYATVASADVLAPSPYVIAPVSPPPPGLAPASQALAPNPYRPMPKTTPPAATATFPPLGPPPPRAQGQDLGY